MENKDFIEIACGRTLDGTTKSTLLMSLSLVDKNAPEAEPEVIAEYSGLTAAGEVFFGIPLTEIDIHCFSHLDEDLKEFWDVVEYYFDLVQEIEEGQTKLPLLEVVIIPNEFDGKVLLTAINPCYHALTAKKVKDMNHIIALAFDKENVFIVEPEEFNVSEYLAEAEREAAERIAMYEQDEINRMKN